MNPSWRLLKADFSPLSQNRRQVWVGRDLKMHLIPPALGRFPFHYPRFLLAPFNLAWNISETAQERFPPLQGCQSLSPFQISPRAGFVWMQVSSPANEAHTVPRDVLTPSHLPWQHSLVMWQLWHSPCLCLAMLHWISGSLSLEFHSLYKFNILATLSAPADLCCGWI